jgi:hypothetical protein
MLYQSLNQRWSANRGCFLMSVFSSKPSMQMRCYRVEYGCREMDVKKPLSSTLGENPRAKTKGESRIKWLQLVASHGNNFIVHKFLVCQEVFSNILIICDFICWFSAKQTNSLVVHRSIFSLSKDAFSVPDVKRG